MAAGGTAGGEGSTTVVANRTNRGSGNESGCSAPDLVAEGQDSLGNLAPLLMHLNTRLMAHREQSRHTREADSALIARQEAAYVLIQTQTVAQATAQQASIKGLEECVARSSAEVCRLNQLLGQHGERWSLTPAALGKVERDVQASELEAVRSGVWLWGLSFPIMSNGEGQQVLQHQQLVKGHGHPSPNPSLNGPHRACSTAPAVPRRSAPRDGSEQGEEGQLGPGHDGGGAWRAIHELV